MYMYMYIYIYTCVYIYIERERERDFLATPPRDLVLAVHEARAAEDRAGFLHLSEEVYAYVCVYIYIYM